MYIRPSSHIEFNQSELKKAIFSNDVQQIEALWPLVDEEIHQLAFVCAVQMGKVQSVVHLLDKVDHHHAQNAISNAAEYGHVPVLKALMAHGCDPSHEHGEALWLSCQGGHWKATRFLRPLCSPDDYTYALYVAAVSEHARCVSVLYDHVDAATLMNQVEQYCEGDQRGWERAQLTIATVIAQRQNQKLHQAIEGAVVSPSRPRRL